MQDSMHITNLGPGLQKAGLSNNVSVTKNWEPLHKVPVFCLSKHYPLPNWQAFYHSHQLCIMINFCFRKHGAIQYKLSRRDGLELNSNDFTIFFNILIYKTVYEIKWQFWFGGLQSKTHIFSVTGPTSTDMSTFYLESKRHAVMIKERLSLPTFLQQKEREKPPVSRIYLPEAS